MNKFIALAFAAVFASTTAIAQSSLSSDAVKGIASNVANQCGSNTTCINDSVKAELNRRFGSDTCTKAPVDKACLRKYGLVDKLDKAGLYELSDDVIAALQGSAGSLSVGATATALTTPQIVTILAAALAVGLAAEGSSGTSGTSGTTGTK